MNYNAICYVETYHDENGTHFIASNCDGLPIYDYYDEDTVLYYEYDDQGRSIYRKETSKDWPSEVWWNYNDTDNGVEIHSTDGWSYEEISYYTKEGKLYASRLTSLGDPSVYAVTNIYFDNGYMAVEDNLDHQLYEYDNQGRIIRMKDNTFEKIYTYYDDGSIGYKNTYLKTGEVVNESHTMPKKLNNLGLGEI